MARIPCLGRVGGRAALGLLLLAASPVRAAGAPSPLEALDARLAEVAAAVADEAARADGRPAVAVVRFLDEADGVRRLGVTAAGMLQGHLTNRPEVRVAEKAQAQVERLLREKEDWLSDLYGADAKAAAARKLLTADRMALGRISLTASEIQLVVTLVSTASGEACLSRTVRLRRVADLEPQLDYVQHPPRGTGRVPVPPIRLDLAIPYQRRLPGGGVEEGVAADGTVLRSGDQFQVRFTPASDCWVYILLVGSGGGCDTLFPYKGVRLGNRCTGGVPYTVPDPGPEGAGRWFFLDETPGVERLYVVASYEPMPDLGAVLKAMAAGRASDPALCQRLDRELDRIRSHPEGPAGDAAPVAVRPEAVPAYEPAPAGPGAVLRGRFQFVKEIRLIHRPAAP